MVEAIGGEGVGLSSDFGRVVDAFPEMVVTMLPDGRCEFVNRRWCDYTGQTPREAADRGWQAALHPDDAGTFLRRWNEILCSGASGEIETRLRRPDGDHRWVRSRIVPSHDAQGNIVRYCSVQTDIHDLKRAEDLLAGEVRLLEMVARGKPLLQVLDALSHLVEELSSGCYCSILGVAPDRKHFRMVAGPSLPEAYNAVLDGLTIDPGYGPCSLAVVTKTPIITADVANDPRWNGSAWLPVMATYGYASCWSMPIMSGTGEVSGIFAIYRREPVGPGSYEQELIDRFTKIAGIAIDRAHGDEALKTSERELRRAHAQLAEGEKLSSTGSFTSDLEADRHSWSDELYRIFEIDRDTTPSIQAARERIHPEDLDIFDEEIRRGLEGKNADFLFRITTPGSGLRYLRGVARLIEHVEGRPIFMGTVQDVTELRRGEEALGKARAELAHVARVTTLNALTASIAHEVSQPLSGILTNANTCLRMLAADPPNLEGAAETARRTIRDTDRATEVIKRLRVLFANRPPTIETVDLNEAAREVIALSSRELQKARVVLQTDFAEDLPPVVGDRVQLQQVILNLLINAADAMAEVEDRSRNLLVKTGNDGDGKVLLSVRDAGVGVDQQAAAKLFAPFYTTKAGGMGVGLSISRSIVESHEGRIWGATNDGPGATFSFSIPCAPGRPFAADGQGRNISVAESSGSGPGRGDIHGEA